ncbi:reverse transcriptase/maturase family protein [Faecalispora jeddahensis]|uniref:reverse transcriptase/maturase family protein n=1 Tax=Faecalispora jeddahensis TaxID=1414721 RepID=UPI0027B8EDF2|nr:reverse transcriptase/maturase family protein [Faecalispora jeddahensis]
MDIIEWKKKNNKPAGYAHFDAKFGLNSAWEYITNPSSVASHSFFPFIHYDQIFYKFSKKNYEKGNPEKTGVKKKIRPICYSAHIDRCIYQYYGFLLNEKYNEYVAKYGFSDSVVAYRTNLHKNNIHFAKQAIAFIRNEDCDIMVGDFTGFFDNLDHKYLKKNLCKVLGIITLSEDWYAVFKNITKYSKWDLMSLLKINSLITEEELDSLKKAREEAETGKTGKARGWLAKLDEKIKALNGQDLVLTKEQFKKYKKDCIEKNVPSADDENQTIRGIPQGSAISAVLSNVYMIEFDEKVEKYVRELNGLYLRYSDDFIIVIPNSCGSSLHNVKEFVFGLVANTSGIDLQTDKTQLYSYENKTITNISQENHHFTSYIDYLGFVFDGKEVRVRPKTVSKYYYRMYRKLNFIINSGGRTKNGKIISCNELYNTYTQKGRNGQYDESLLPQKVIKKDKNNPYKSGNFFSYVVKADRIFNPADATIVEPITRDTKRHMLKIRRKRDEIKGK